MILNGLIVTLEGGLQRIELVLERSNLSVFKVIHFLVDLLDIDFIVGTSGREQGYSSKEQRCKFGEFDFHKVGIELKINYFLIRWC